MNIKKGTKLPCNSIDLDENNSKKSRNFIIDVLNMIIDPKSAWFSKILGVVSIIYLLSPVDAIPDVIPILGFLDDAGMFLLTVKMFMEQLKTYRLKKQISH